MVSRALGGSGRGSSFTRLTLVKIIKGRRAGPAGSVAAETPHGAAASPDLRGRDLGRPRRLRGMGRLAAEIEAPNPRGPLALLPGSLVFRRAACEER